ncbi:hypothetical protein A3Q56_02457 [Intoshia linei]|uniref:Uncharacterized protein n=1 Tax=Intoshia linei TaxID=1819745 RepID=A0A177B687_9BILA|nr:hypothetical protein A3Q56_02457 [Intoshia linei]
MENMITEHLKGDEIYSLHFDNKKLGGVEYQVSCLKNCRREIRLGVISLLDSKASTISDGIINLLESYNCSKSIKMIICDMTNTNSGRFNGVKLQKKIENRFLDKSQYIVCQHHIWDRILKHY